MLLVDSLRRKPIPNKETGINTKVATADSGIVLPEMSPDLPAKQDIKITDASASSSLDRTAILERIAVQKRARTKKPTLTQIRPTKDMTVFSMVSDERVPPREPPATLSVAAQEIINKAKVESAPKFVVLASSYYMNNRKRFIGNFSRLFQPYRESSMNLEMAETGDLFDNQKIVRDYLNIYSPYRGLLLYHGLGLGKTLAGIGIAEGFKTDKQIYIFTPASLKANFFAELKKGGDTMYKKNQHWAFISAKDDPEIDYALTEALSLPEGYVAKRGGAWLCDSTKPENFAQLTTREQAELDEQIDTMIRTKYIDINYNGIDARSIARLTRDGTINPFDHSVVLVDEAHGFVSTIVNKLGEKRSASAPDHFRIQLYKLLMDAVDARMVLLSGTPVINSPHEIAVMMNILRGYIKTWSIPAKSKDGHRMTSDEMRGIIETDTEIGSKIFDYLDYRSNGTLVITRNPYGFVNAEAPQVRIDPATVAPRARKTRKAAAVEAAAVDENKIEDVFAEPQEIPIEEPITESIVEEPTDESMEEPAEEPAEEPDTEPTTEPADELDAEPTEKPDTETETPPGIVSYERRRVTRKAKPLIDGGAPSVSPNYNGVELDETGNISDVDFIERICNVLAANNVAVNRTGIKQTNHICLPDTLDEFAARFLNANADGLVHTAALKKRIIGLTSYFRTAQENLLPTLITAPDGSPYNIVRVEMSDYQFGIYVKARQEEESKSKNASKHSKADDMFGSSSAYRLYTRACCNFVFPSTVEKPQPATKRTTGIVEDVGETDDTGAAAGEPEIDESELGEAEESRDERIVRALTELDTPEILDDNGLATYTPKFAAILNNIRDPAHVGLHLLYSFFNSLEGIGIMRLVLKQHGFAEFALKRIDGEWRLDVSPEDEDKPRFAIYSGSTDPKAKEIIRDVYNNNWDAVPPAISAALKRGADGNLYGAAIKLLMITAAGAEGINLKNTRYVHIVEPYWHMVRLEQVIGRARRLKSHMELPEELRTVEAFVYTSVFTEAQIKTNATAQMRMKDVSKYDEHRIMTADETLFENASIKNKVNQQLLTCLKETSIECNIHSELNAKEKLECFTFGEVRTNGFAFSPMVDEDMEAKRDTIVKAVAFSSVSIGGVEYAMDKDTAYFYDKASFEASQATGSTADLVYKGRVITGDDGRKLVDFGDAPPV